MAEYKITPQVVRRGAKTTDTSVKQRVKAPVTRQDTPDGEWEHVGTGWGKAYTTRRAAERAEAKAREIIVRDQARRADAIRQALDKHRTSE